MISINFTNDEVSAEINIDEESGRSLNGAQIVTLLSQKGIQEQYIDKAAVQSIIANKIFGKYVTVAKGKEAVGGIDGKVKLKFRNELKATKPKEREDGSVDHRDLGYVDICRENKELLEIIPPTLGNPGISVKGAVIPARDGIPAQVKLGENVKFSDDNKAVISTGTGYALYDLDHVIAVKSNLLIEGDIDYSVGNIYFPGDVEVTGSVIDGFKIVAGGSITVHKDIKNATVEAKGDITVGGYIKNKISGYVRAARNVSAQTIRFAKVQAELDIIIDDEIKFSEIIAKQKISAKTIIGGTTTCFGTVSAHDIGSRKETGKTYITFTQDLTWKKQIAELEEIVSDIYPELDKLEGEIAEIETYLSSDNIPAEEFHEFEQIYEKYNSRKNNMVNRINEIEQKKNTILMEVKKRGKATLEVHNMLCPGVTLQFVSQKMVITAVKMRVKVFEEDEIIKFRPVR